MRAAGDWKRLPREVVDFHAGNAQDCLSKLS